MTWLVWRQYRIQGAVASVLLAAAAAVIFVDGFQVASHWHSILVTCAGNSACLSQQGPLVNLVQPAHDVLGSRPGRHQQDRRGGNPGMGLAW